jgi:hypothetical protein
MTRQKTSTLDIRSSSDKYIHALKMASRLYSKMDRIEQSNINASANDVEAFLRIHEHRLNEIVKKGESK